MLVGGVWEGIVVTIMFPPSDEPYRLVWRYLGDFSSREEVLPADENVVKLDAGDFR